MISREIFYNGLKTGQLWKSIRYNSNTAFSFTSGISQKNKPTIEQELGNVINPSVQNSTNQSQYNPNEIIKNYVLNCRFTKNNTHITYSAVVEDTNYLKNNRNLTYNQKFQYYVKLPQKVKFAISTGCLGFRKAARGEYEAGFQTANKAFQMMQEKNLLNKKIDIVLRDFGKGRTAFIAALNGKEGTNIRKKVNSISDATPLKFGGVRSPRIRRL